MGPMGLMRPMGATRLISLVAPISHTSETHRILILGPSATDHQLQNVLRALRSRCGPCPLYFHPCPPIFDPLAEVAPHRHSLIAVTMDERATRSGLTPNAMFKWRVMICPPRVGI